MVVVLILATLVTESPCVLPHVVLLPFGDPTLNEDVFRVLRGNMSVFINNQE
jgi:hypothetical protein